MIKFMFDKDVLLIMQEGDTIEYPTEWIPKRELGNLDDYGDKTSFWVNYFSSFPFIQKSSLYFLAKLIQTRCPDNKIDWFKTFYKIEFFHMVKKRKETILNKSPNKSLSKAKSCVEVMEAYLTARAEIKAEVSSGQIAALVQTNAAKYNVSLT